jgi:dihydroxyacid dehydratase/phosphogluconate dehydratase
MEDFYYAGGLAAVHAHRLDEVGLASASRCAMTVNGQKLASGDNVIDERAATTTSEVIRPLEPPADQAEGGISHPARQPVRRDGAVIKPSAATAGADAAPRQAPWCSKTSSTTTPASTIRRPGHRRELA